MKTTKKLLVLVLVVALAAVSVIPATFSWYTHNASAEGKKINYSEDSMSISIKTGANDIKMKTYVSDVNGVATTTVASDINIAADSATKKAVKYYKTEFENSGSNDVMVDFETVNMPNNADFVIGTLSPTLNEKAYASRAVRSKATGDTVRVYFKTTSSFYPYWTKYVSGNVTFNSSIENDMNIAYRISGGSSDTYAKLNKCDNYTITDDTRAYDAVYYADIPTNTEYFYFFNHWYLASDSNREWNRTLDITDLTAGKLYYLTGNNIDGKEKECLSEAVSTDLVALNTYYSNVRMSLGSSVFADVSLKKTSDADDFVPEYYGSSITYKSNSPSVCTINSDGLITPVAQGKTTITTTIKGKFGDSKTITTNVDIPEKINQVPIIQNLKVPAGEKVFVDWYALNRSSSVAMSTEGFIFTI